MRLIDTDAFEFEATNGVMNGVLFMGRATGRTLQLVRSCLEAMINNAPTVDAVEVVRCKDCYYTEESMVDGCVWCNEHAKAMLETDWCSYGERKDDNGKA